ncbi:pterin-4-alpha-carbinolamine dehydratase [Pseudoclavibacter sp. RFBG4]|uniref:4a-hydroxytetrahydrobiopterin dehydratase n=1 Tax=Pseudoclavibacter sp. RFBG4 TaxID=2080575 RepID=UPI000CE76B7D|nr:4a-hydroxytetrahydrobiopterin dehydratase [Pseudoclavibacter sp. RFBG4]PPG26349.1 pterin-4-alpha-carbinolamine dehydratase [Pseudoclavibacter sp. RFBG4]
MSDRVSPRQFRQADGTADWRVVGDGARANFTTGDFARGAAFVAEIARAADEADHHPDVDLRYGSVMVRLISHDVGDISERDAALAARISEIARGLGIEASPDSVQSIQIAIDVFDLDAALPFWEAVLAYERRGGEDLADPIAVGPNVWLQQIDAPRAERNTMHVDVYVPRDQADARVAAALAAGGRIVDDANAPEHWTLADPEGNEVDVAPWRDDSSWKPE